MSTSSSARDSTPAPPDVQPILPGATPAFVAESAATYANVTIDDFSPLITYSGLQLSGDWVSPLTDSGMSAARPVPQRDWYLGTYKRTEKKNATITIEFWGSEIYLYGDTGPAYGAYALQLDQETPLVRSAYNPAIAVGSAHFLDSLKNLTDGRHELLITNLGTREGLVEGEGLLFDFALVRQKVGPLNGNPRPGVSDIEGNGLASENKTGAWALNSVNEDVVTASGQDANQPKIFYSTQENGASLAHSFDNATAIQVYGTRNATHGLYRATLSTGFQSLLSQTYNASAPCGFPGADAQYVLPGCEWQGSVLKFAAGGLDPVMSYELKLENIDPGNKVFDVDLIRTFDASGKVIDPAPGGGANNSNGASESSRGAASGHIMLFLFTWYFLWSKIIGRL